MDDKRCETALYNTIMVDARYYVSQNPQNRDFSDGGAKIPYASWPKNHKQHCDKFNKDFKNSAQPKKKQKAHGAYTTKVNPHINLG